MSRKIKKGEEEVIVPLQRVNSQLVTEEGFLVCMEPGTCKYSCQITTVHSFELFVRMKFWECKYIGVDKFEAVL